MCGIMGVFTSPNHGRSYSSAYQTYLGLLTLQHRGEEAAGIATNNSMHKDVGLASGVFNDDIFAQLEGPVAIGHVRYGTTGSSSAINAQPHYKEGCRKVYVVHNGNLTNTDDLRRSLQKRGYGFKSASDTEVIATMLANSDATTFEEAIRLVCRQLVGSFALAIITEDKLYAVRDSRAIRPLSLGCATDETSRSIIHLIASETCAFDVLDGKAIRELKAGEILSISADGIASSFLDGPREEQPCSMEFVYFAGPTSVMHDIAIDTARKRMGQILARESGDDIGTADIVVPVLDSGRSAAIGYSRETGIPLDNGLIRGRYIGRVFIAPDGRNDKLRLKHVPVASVVDGKRVILVDDSIVRGDTTSYVVERLKKAGAQEVHVRISSPPYRYTCNLGIDTSTSDQLIAAKMSPAEIKERIGADSLKYLSLEGLKRAIGLPGANPCMGCFTGRYPIEVPAELDKHRLEV